MKKKNIKNRVVKVLILFLVTLVFYGQNYRDANAMLWEFTKPVCMAETNDFIIESVQLEPDTNAEEEFFRSEEIFKKYHLISTLNKELNEKVHNCKLNYFEEPIKYQVKYRDLSPTGMCGQQPEANLKIWIGDKLIVDLKSFNDGCFNHAKDISKVHLKINERYNENNISLRFYMYENMYFTRSRSCVIDIGGKINEITYNSCSFKKTKARKTLPINDKHFDNPFLDK